MVAVQYDESRALEWCLHGGTKDLRRKDGVVRPPDDQRGRTYVPQCVAERCVQTRLQALVEHDARHLYRVVRPRLQDFLLYLLR